jgi:diadenosine tetraphosphatase ApaH/serine/threonine PP2A family protein phosphatase
MAVYERLGEMKVDRIICLGDIVGYGPAPAQCLDLVLSYCDEVVRGNHDEAALDPNLGKYFNNAALAALNWTRDQLGPYHLIALSHMKTRIRLGDALLLVHDTPALHERAYVHEVDHAVVAFESLVEGICLHGHTHLPTVFSTNQGKATAENITFQVPTDGEPIVLDPTQRHLCNPGAVGQPRDSDPRASFAILEYTAPEAEAIFTVHRTEYDITAAKEATEKAGLPVILADRLSMGA